jgi:ornithine cyclodeaminase/alanine dehydrogenase-like protein (mu-crystallin family)
MSLFLTEHDVEQLVDMRAALDAVQEALGRLAKGEAANVPRVRAKGDGIVLHSMSAAADYLGLVGTKCYTTTRDAARFHLFLYEQSSGRLVAVIEANHLGQLRTGATSGVAASWLAPPSAGELGLFGSGYQAETQLAALCAVRPIKRAFVYSRDEARRTDFAERMSRQLAIEVVPVDRPQEAAEELPIVVTATTSRQPVFDGSWLAEEALVCAVGSNWLQRAELDTTTIRRADHIVCDSVKACRNEAGDFVEALHRGIFDWSRAVELSSIVAGQSQVHARGRITVFKSVGLAIEDIALGSRVLELARAQGLGVPLPF